VAIPKPPGEKRNQGEGVAGGRMGGDSFKDVAAGDIDGLVHSYPVIVQSAEVTVLYIVALTAVRR